MYVTWKPIKALSRLEICRSRCAYCDSIMSHSQWGYTRDNGPDKWTHYAPAAKGMHQSPIDIQTSCTVYEPSLQRRPLQIRYLPGSSRLLKNTGHGVQVGAGGSSPAYINSWLLGGPYRHKYQLEQFHFHWGRNNDQGSEHLLDGKAFASELHLVHWNTEIYKSFAEAAKSACGLAVLGVFLRIGKEHSYLRRLTDLLPRVAFAGDEARIKGGFDASCILPGDRSSYYTYIGSLTTPPCYESIQFLIFREPIEISEAQMNTFRQLFSIKRDESVPRDEFKGRMVANFRPPQDLNNRNIIRSFL